MWFLILMPLDHLLLVAAVGGFVVLCLIGPPNPECVKLGPFLIQREDVACTSLSGTVWKEDALDRVEPSVSLSSPLSATTSSSGSSRGGTMLWTMLCMSWGVSSRPGTG